MHARHIILWEPGKLYESRAFISRLIYILYYTEKSVIETNCKNNWPSQPSYIFPIQLIFPKTLWIQTTFIGINITRVYQRTFPHCLLPRSISVSMSISLLSVFGSDGVLMLKGIEDVGMVCNISCQRTSRAA